MYFEYYGTGLQAPNCMFHVFILFLYNLNLIGVIDVFQVGESMENRIYREEKVSLTSEIDSKKDKGVYVGVEEDVDTQTENEDDGLGDIWQEMSMALEFSKVVYTALKM